MSKPSKDFMNGVALGITIAKKLEDTSREALEDLLVDDKCVLHETANCGCWVMKFKDVIDLLDEDRKYTWDIPIPDRILSITPRGSLPNYVIRGNVHGLMWLFRQIAYLISTGETQRECYTEQAGDKLSFTLSIKNVQN